MFTAAIACVSVGAIVSCILTVKSFNDLLTEAGAYLIPAVATASYSSSLATRRFSTVGASNDFLNLFVKKFLPTLTTLPPTIPKAAADTATVGDKATSALSAIVPSAVKNT